MLIRLLVAVLTLVGPVPFRACTCAATHTCPVPESALAPAAHAEGKMCHCGHHAPEAGPGGEVSAHDCAGECDGPSHPVPHDRDCPAASPQLPVRDAGTPATAGPPAADSAHETVFAEPSPPPVVSALERVERPPAPDVPLYLALRTLRN